MNKLLLSVLAILLVVTAKSQTDVREHGNACVNAETIDIGVDANHPLAIELLKNETFIT